LDIPDSEHVVHEREEEGERMQPLPACPTWKTLLRHCRCWTQ
jgi:hypothetical protein